MSEDLKKAAYILATLSQHIEFPFKNQWLSKIFQNAFTSGIDDESLRVLKTWIKSKWSGTFLYVKEIIKYQEWEDIFAWPNKLLQPFQVADIPKKIEKVGFFLCCTNNNYIEEIEGYILVVKLFLPEGILKCKYGEEWKDCSSQETGINDKPKISNVIFGFVKNWEEPPKNEIEKAEDQGTRTEKIKDNPQYVIENDTKNINADQINEKFKQIEEELSKCKQINECLKAELTDVKIENKKASNDISEVKAMIENMRSSLNEKIDETSIDIKKSLNYLKEGLDKGQLFMENVLENCQSNLNQLKSYKNLSTSSKSVPLKKNQDFSFPFNAVSDYFQCINKTAQDCIQKYNELEIKYNSLIDISNNMMIETNKMHSALEAKINEIEEKTQKISIPNGNELISSTKNALDSKTINKDNPKRKKRGLANIGNSCYMNSVLQIFASIPSFIENIKNIENDLFYCLGGIISSITDPYSIKTDEKLRKLRNLLAKKYPMFGGNTENDSKELYVIIINLFMELCQSEMFLINKNQAIICESNHRLKLPEHQLFLTIPDNELSIEEWLNQLKNENELFSGDNNLFCETCGQRSDSEMVTESIEPHEILAFYNAKSKNPIENIPDVVSLGENHYEIFGIIWYNRSHYIAYTREEGIWNEYNDNYVTTDKHPNPKNIYMLFYKKVIIN